MNEENTTNQNINTENSTIDSPSHEGESKAPRAPREDRPYNREGKPPYNRERKPYNREEGSSEEGGAKPYFKKSKFGAFKRKKCRFCAKSKQEVDKELNYKNVELLEKFVSDRGKLLPSRATGNCSIHQRKVKVEVKKARYIAFLPFSRIEKLNK
jgi:small subunit ribosomal protein S18